MAVPSVAFPKCFHRAATEGRGVYCSQAGALWRSLESMTEFICNLCGKSNRCSAAALDREESSCSGCGSNVRTRGLMQVLSMELFGVNLALPHFPRVKSLRGLGTSDSSQYANLLAEKFDYRNTFFHRPPYFDIANPPEEEFGRYDFLISSEVFEHVVPPAEVPFRNAFRLLKPGGVLVATVPYSLESTMSEHFPDLHQFGFAQLGGDLVLVNRTRAGEVQVFEHPVFHISWGGASLEMREFCQADLKNLFVEAGFDDLRVHAEDYAPFGILRAESWSLPIAARKGEFVFSRDATRDVIEEWRDLNLKFHSEMRRLDRAFWFHLGRKLKLL